MRRLIVLFVCCLGFFATYAQEKSKGIVFETGTFDQALAKAVSNGKNGPNMVLVDCYTTWCSPCKKMAADVFPQEKVGNYINKSFVSIKMDMERGEGKTLAKKYNVRAYPTFLLLDAKGNEINRLVGGGSAEKFIEDVQAATNPATSYLSKKRAYESSKSFADALNYLAALNDVAMENEAKQFLDQIFPGLPLKEKYSTKLWPYLENNIRDHKSTLTSIVLREKAEADKGLTRARMDNVLRNGLKSFALNYVWGQYTNLDKNEALNKIRYLAYVGDESPEYAATIKIAELYAENKISDIEPFLNIKVLGNLSSESRNTIESMVFAIKDITTETKLKYYNSKIDYYNKQAEEIKQKISGYTKSK